MLQTTDKGGVSAPMGLLVAGAMSWATVEGISMSCARYARGRSVRKGRGPGGGLVGKPPVLGDVIYVPGRVASISRNTAGVFQLAARAFKAPRQVAGDPCAGTMYRRGRLSLLPLVIT